MWHRLRHLTWNQYLGTVAVLIGTAMGSEPVIIAGLGTAAAPVRVEKKDE